MKKEEMVKRIEALEKSIWYHNMADRLTFWEEKELNEERRELEELKRELNKEEKKEEEEKREEKKEERFIVWDKVAKINWFFNTKEEAIEMIETYNNWAGRKTDRCVAQNF